MLFAVATTCFGQNYIYKTTGNVKNSEGQPLVGAVITQVGTYNLSLTDLNGNYSMNTSAEFCSLCCTYSGYKSTTIIRHGQVNNFILEEDNTAPDGLNYPFVYEIAPISEADSNSKQLPQ